MTNADLFKDIFGIYATELWAMPEPEFLEWLNSKSKTGKWKHFSMGDDCPFCGYSTGKYERPSKYCPDCGARLERSDL